MKSNRQPVNRITAVLCAAVLLLAGCGGSQKESAADAKTQSTSEVQAVSETVDSEGAESKAAEQESTGTASQGESSEAVSDVPAYYGVLSSFTAVDLDGNEVTEEIFAGSRLTMVNIWGTFCGPCLQEMPYLAEIAASYDAKEFQIIGIVSDTIARDGSADPDQMAYARSLAEETGADYLHLVPTGELLELLYYIQYVPTTVFVDAEGKVIGEEYIGSRTEADWRALIQSVQEAQETAG